MRKLFAGILALLGMLALVGTAFADSCPLPAKNTDVDINFSGFTWYTDYRTTLSTATERGLKNSFDWSRDNFSEDSCVTPHWHTVYNSINSFAGSESGCGGYLNYLSDIPNVAGYKVDELKLYFMWNPEGSHFQNYQASGEVCFYMARYEFDVTDKEACYKDLLGKLKGIYGQNPESSTYGWISPTTYTVWVNGEGALVALAYDSYDVTLVYMAPGAEEKLCTVEKLVKENEIAQAANDTSGL